MSKYEYSGEERFRPISSWGYVGYSILFMIPLIGFILLIVFSLSNEYINRRNFARSYWCWLLISIIVIIFIFVVVSPAIFSALEALLSY